MNSPRHFDPLTARRFQSGSFIHIRLPRPTPRIPLSTRVGVVNPPDSRLLEAIRTALRDARCRLASLLLGRRIGGPR